MTVKDVAVGDIRTPVMTLDMVRSWQVLKVMEFNNEVMTKSNEEGRKYCRAFFQTVLGLEQMFSSHLSSEYYDEREKLLSKLPSDWSVLDGNYEERQKFCNVIITWFGLILDMPMSSAGMGESIAGITRLGFYEDLILKEKGLLKESVKLDEEDMYD